MHWHDWCCHLIRQLKKNLKKEKKKPKPRDCCSEGDLIAAVADRVGVAAGARRLK